MSVLWRNKPYTVSIPSVYSAYLGPSLISMVQVRVHSRAEYQIVELQNID